MADAAAQRRSDPARIPRALLLAAVTCFAVTTVTGTRAAVPAVGALDHWLGDGFALAAAAVCLLRALRLAEERRAWAVLGLGLACYGGGTVYFHTVVSHLDPPPFPSLADAGWLAFYPAVYVSVVLLLRGRVDRFHPSVWLDGLVGALGAAAVAAAFVFQVVVHDTHGSVATVVVNLAYPVADLLLLLLVAGVLSVLGWRPGRAWWLLGLGLLLFVAGDTIFLFQAATGTYVLGGRVDVLWPAALALLALASGQPARRSSRARFEGTSVLVIPTGFALAAVAVLVIAAGRHLPPVAVALAAATVVVAIARTTLTFLEVQRLAESRLQARTDDLTGLINRRGFYERLAHTVTETDAVAAAVLVVDLDRFKEVNDSLGHHVGDELLTLVGRRLAEVIRGGDTLARLGGDEFAVLLRGADARAAWAAAERLRASLVPPFEVGGVTVHMDASVGIAVWPDHAATVAELLQRADIAMYAAKAERSGVQAYHGDSDGQLRDRLALIGELRSALDRGEFVLHYQPKLELDRQVVSGVEALVRWQHPERGLLFPDSFLEVAERAGLMRRLTLTVLGEALRQCRAWWDAGLRVSVAVNLSPSNLLDVELPDLVDGLLASFGLPPSALELEITETVLMLDRVRSAAVLSTLRDLGVRIAVDDYGTGYSSLAYLRELPVDELKLDKSFVMHLDADPLAAAIVRSTVGLAHSLGLRMVAEGVETASALETLRRYGCDVAQGYHLGRPQPAEQLTASLTRAPRPPDRPPARASAADQQPAVAP